MFNSVALNAIADTSVGGALGAGRNDHNGDDHAVS